MTDPVEILDVAELDFRLDAQPWTFAAQQGDRIAAEWAKATAEKPALFNGRVLLLTRRATHERPDGALRLSGTFLETDFAAMLAWKRLGFPGGEVENAFAMAALRSADGAFLMGEMAAHTSNSGHIYFPAGTPDPSDVFDGRVDLDASARRELREETGLDAAEAAVAPGWTIVTHAHRVACMKRMRLAEAADEAKARIEALIARDAQPEFSRIHIVRSPADIDRTRTPPVVVAYLEAEFRNASSPLAA